ncbi:MAG: DUF1786 domain-containing protein [Chloroflexi bacterium]|nr:DUF1786 domain-containing protein [Chloroflexota bacterium]
MRVLCIDVGTGTQDILLFDSEQELENCIQLILPSPTRLVAERVRRATARGQSVLLEGRTMGGGPCAWAVEEHIRKGLTAYATPDAARTFDDELPKVERMGVRIVSEDEAASLVGVERIAMHDLDLPAITAVLERFGVEPRFDAIAVAVFDHGNAPPGVSDRAFRFEYIAEVVRANDLTAFAYLREAIPERLTRMRAVAADAPPEIPLLVMDTGPAAVVGALEDRHLRQIPRVLVANLGNFHTLAFHLAEGRVVGLFEHHTGLLSCEKLDGYLDQLAAGTISNEVVFADMGHGALVIEPVHERPTFLGVTGPRRGLLSGSRYHPYLAVPHGHMMLAGCYGLLRALAAHRPDLAPAIEARLGPRAS